MVEITDATGMNEPLRPEQVRFVFEESAAEERAEQQDEQRASAPQTGEVGGIQVIVRHSADEDAPMPAPEKREAGATFTVSANELPILRLRARAILDNDAAAEARRVLDDVRRLSRVATAGDPTHVLGDLAKLINGWAVVVEVSGDVVASAGAGRVHLTDAVAAASGRPVKIRDSNIQVHPLGALTKAPGYLVVSGRIRSLSRVRALAEHAAALLNLTLHAHDHSNAERLARELFTDFIRLPERMSGASVAQRLGFRGEEIQSFKVSTASRQLDLEAMMSRWLQELGAPLVYRRDKDAIAGFLMPANVPRFEQIVQSVGTEAGLPISLGLSSVHPVAHASRAWSEAAIAYSIAVDRGQQVSRFGDLPLERVLRTITEFDGRERMLDVLRPVRDLANGEQLIHELFHYLDTNGNLGESAARADVHRHTMRAHIQLIERECGLAFASMNDRTMAWLSLLNRPARTS